MTATPGRTCRHYTEGVGHCGATSSVRRFLPGDRCPDHTPSKVAGEAEAGGRYCAPARCYCGNEACPAYVTYTLRDRYVSHLDAWKAIDARAIARGSRRSDPATFAAARTAVAEQKQRDARLRKATR